MALTTTSQEILEIKIDGIDLVAEGYRSIIKMQKMLEGNTGQTDRAVDRSAKGFGKFQQGLISAGAAVQVLTAGLALLQRGVSALKAPVGLAIDFERAFGSIETLLEGPKGSFNDLRDGLLDLAKSVPQTAGDISKAAYQAISAGIPKSEVVGFLQAASKTAVAAGGSLTQSVELLTAATNAFGEQGIDAEKASDIFFSTVREGVLTMESLGSVFGQGAALSGYGVSLEEMGAALAALTKRGIPASEAMTMLNATVKLIASDSMPGAKAMRALGIETGVTTLQSKGLTGVLEQVLEKTQGNTAVINTFGRRAEAIKGVINLLAGDMGNYNKALKANHKSTGATTDAYAKMVATTQGAIDQFKALSEDILRRMGEEVLPTLNAALGRFSQWVASEGPGIAKQFSEIANAFLSFGVWVIENSGTIINMLRGLFAGVAVNQFAKSIMLARVQLVRFSATAAASAAGGFATSLQRMGPMLAGVFSNPALAGPALAGALMLGGLLGDALGQQMADNFAIVSEREIGDKTVELRHTIDSLKADLVEQEKTLGEMIGGRGFKALAGIERADKQIQAGKLLAPSGKLKATEGGLAFTGDKSELMSPGEAVRKLGVDEAERRADAAALEISSSIKMAEARLRALASERARTAEVVKVHRDEKVAALAGEAKVESERAQLKGIDKQIKTTEANLKAMRANAQAAVAAVEAVKDRRTPSRVAVPADKKAEKAAKKVADDEAARLARLEAARNQHRIRELKGQGRHDEAALEALRQRHAAELKAHIADGGKVLRLKELHQQEEFNLALKLGAAKAAKAEAEAEAERERLSQQALEVSTFRSELKLRAREQAGDEFGLRLLELETQHQREREIAKNHADLLLAVDRYYAEEKRRLVWEGHQATVEDIQSTGSAVGGSIQSILGSLSSLRAARMRAAKTDLEAGKISKSAYEQQSKAAFDAERQVIIAKGVMSGFLAATETALALTSFALGPAGFAQGVAHTAAAAAHAVNAANSGAMADMAYNANIAGLRGGGGGGGGGGGPSPSLGARALGDTQATDLERGERPSIQFGDIVLSDVPALLSSDGLNHLGRNIAQSVTDEINRQQEIPGGFRMNGG